MYSTLTGGGACDLGESLVLHLSHTIRTLPYRTDTSTNMTRTITVLQFFYSPSRCT